MRRHWGYWEIITIGEGYKVKILQVDPGKSLSYQRHQMRAEHWVVVSGLAKVIIDREAVILRENESAYIPKKAWHRLANLGKKPLVVIEVSTGICDEEDIERRDDNTTA